MIHTHRLIFKFDPSYPLDMSKAKARLPRYVDDLNYILKKNTNRQFSFDPEKDIVVEPYISTGYFDLPSFDYDVWITVKHTTYSIGWSDSQMTGEVSLNGIPFPDIYTPEENLQGYWNQIDIILHEFFHACGAGIGEYRSLRYIENLLNAPVKIDIDASDLNDSFWKPRKEMLHDPLTFPQFANPVFYPDNINYDWLLKNTKACELTALLINKGCRVNYIIPAKDLAKIEFLVTDRDYPIKDCNVKIWSAINHKLLVDTNTDKDGKIIWAWTDRDLESECFTDNLRYFYISLEGYYPSYGYFCIYDMQLAHVKGNPLRVKVQLINKIASNPKFQMKEEGKVRVINAIPHLQYTLSYSKDAKNWEVVTSAKAISNQLLLVDTQHTESFQYYKVSVLTSPIIVV